MEYDRSNNIMVRDTATGNRLELHYILAERMMALGRATRIDTDDSNADT